MAQVAQKCWRVSILGDNQHLPDHGLEKPAVAGTALGRGAGQDDLQRCLPSPTVLRLCGGEKNKQTIKLDLKTTTDFYKGKTGKKWLIILLGSKLILVCYEYRPVLELPKISSDNVFLSWYSSCFDWHTNSVNGSEKFKNHQCKRREQNYCANFGLIITFKGCGL